MKNHPPKLAQRLFDWLCGSAFAEDLRGDLDELYTAHSQSKGKFRANLMYWFQVVSLGFSYALKKRKKDASYSTHYDGHRLTMLHNYLKISVRNLKKQKTFTVLNIIGLAMGMSIMILSLAMYVDLNEFDEHHRDADRIYRILTTVEEDGDVSTYASCPPALANLITDQVPQIETAIPINDRFYTQVQTDKSDLELEGYVTTPAFLETFDFPLASGSRLALNEPNTLVITHELAQKIYGSDQALGEIIQTKKWGPMKIGGVLQPFPKHTHLLFDALVGTATMDPFNSPSIEEQWVSYHGNYFYTKLPIGWNEEDLLTRIELLSKEGDAYFSKENKEVNYSLQALVDINPNLDIEDDLGVVFEHTGFLLFFGIALLIMLPACFNYANMSIARALKRAKEIGIRKVIGGQRRQITEQFVVETIIVTLIATVLSIYIFQLIKTEFTSMLVAGSSLSLDLTWQMLVVFLLFGGVVGVATGIFPALYFANISPLTALKSNVSDGKVSISGLRKGLLTAQFTLTLIFMIGIGTLLSEYRYSLTYNLGFSKENVLVIPIKRDKQQLLKNTLLSNPDVQSVSFSSSLPGTNLADREYVYFPELQDSMRFYSVKIDDHFIDHMKLEMLWGESPNPENTLIPDVVVNEEFMKDYRVIQPDGDSLRIELANGPARISGVVKNYNHEPLNSRIYPMVLSYSETCPYALVTIASNDLQHTLSSIEQSWDQVFPEQVFEASFLTQEIEKAYHFFRVALKIFGFLAFLASTISCLGLLGMVIYSTENRTKEVAIRKILGASKAELLRALGGTFFKLWAIAIAIGVPIAYAFYDFALIRMYNKFTEGVGALEIILSVLVTVGLGALAILWQTNRISKVNPAVNLRNE